jgi:hypothetical protein
MRHIRERQSGSISSSRSGNRKRRKSKANTSSSSSKKRSLIKRVAKGTRKKSSLSRVRGSKQRTQKVTKARIPTKRSPKARASRKSVFHKSKVSSRPLRTPSKKQMTTRGTNKKVIRILGHGQFSVDSETLRKLNSIDSSIVRGFEKEDLTDEEFRMKIEELEEIITKKGKLLDPKMIVSSDIILPGTDLTIEEASKIFHGEGIIPGLD